MKKRILFIALHLFSLSFLYAQNVGIGTTTPNASSKLEISSATSGLLIPRMNTSSVSAISSPAKGLLVLDTAVNQLMVNMGTAASPNWQTIVYKSGWNLTGNSNTNSTTHFIGTTDVKPLLFRVNNLPAGLIHPTSYNVGLGLGALAANTTGNNNTAIGGNALLSNTIGIWNTAAGTNALFVNDSGNYNSVFGGNSMANNTAGTENAAIGYASLESNTTGSYNVAIGKDALYSNVDGSENTVAGQGSMFANISGYQNCAFGRNALHENIGGRLNTAIGYNALFSNITGQYNTASGDNALYYNTTGIGNTANGHYALTNNETGDGNTAIGTAALGDNASGSFNTAVGNYALEYITTGNYNTSIGHGSGIQSDYNNTVTVGYSSFTNQADCAILGNSSTIKCGGYANWTNLSDGRFKKNVKENVPGLDFIKALRPVTYTLDMHGLDQFIYKDKTAEYEKAMAAGIEEKEKIVQTGFIAQEVEAAAKKIGYDFDAVQIPKDISTNHYSLSYASFVVPLVKAVQEQQVIIETQQQKINDLEKRLDALEKIMNK